MFKSVQPAHLKRITLAWAGARKRVIVWEGLIFQINYQHIECKPLTRAAPKGSNCPFLNSLIKVQTNQFGAQQGQRQPLA